MTPPLRWALAGLAFALFAALYNWVFLGTRYGNAIFWACTGLNYTCTGISVYLNWRRVRDRRLIQAGDVDRIPDICTTCWYVGCCKECPDWSGV